jgi:hypothetical protein
MCIIIYKDYGVPLPDAKVLLTCLSTHKDGFGAMWRVDEQVNIMKGLFTLPQIERVLEFIPEDTEAAFHFRMATHGGVSAGNCHPFPLSSRNDALTMTHGTFDTGLMHNGIMNNFGTRSQSKLSDTMNFVKYLERVTKRKRIYDKMRGHFKNHFGKFIIFTPKETITFGDFVEDKKLKYSNTTYRSFVTYVNNEQPRQWHKDHFVQIANLRNVIHLKGGEVRYRGACGRLIYYKNIPIFVEVGAWPTEVDLIKDDIDLMLDSGEMEFKL